MMVTVRLRLVLATVTLAVLAACQTVPETGRSALSLVPRSQTQAMGAEAFSDLKDKEGLSEDPRARDRARRVGRRVAGVAQEATGVPAGEWEIAAFAGDPKNAFALPGGHIGVYEGILEVAESDAELATVMSHEVAHVAARHGGERMSQSLLVSLGGLALSAALQEEPERTRQLYLAAFGLGAQVGFLLPYSRRHELEADRIGLIYMARAGYDPRAAVDFWQGMEEAGKGGEVPELLSTHPSHGRRIDRLKRFMPEALKAYRQTRAKGAGKGGGDLTGGVQARGSSPKEGSGDHLPCREVGRSGARGQGPKLPLVDHKSIAGGQLACKDMG
ncbi:M48 family metallopeptidase [Thiohalorhabdus sp.]|uniref:M48 family metallopeptidase n=1 Tax=Thiohalorhabdus sp. TaxID=3094134 RepID=UPI002FC3DCFC